MEGVQRRIFVRFDKKNVKMTGLWKLMKTKEIFDPVSRIYLPKYTSECYYPSVQHKAYIEGVQRRILDQIDEKLSKLQTFENS